MTPTITDAFYGAPTVVHPASPPRASSSAAEDCAMAAENMMLAADALGVGSCYIGQGVGRLRRPLRPGDSGRSWAIPGDHYAVCQVLLGYPRPGDPHPTPKPRNSGRVLRV